MKTFPGEHAPGPPLGASAFGGRLFEPPFVKSWIRPSKGQACGGRFDMAPRDVWEKIVGSSC